MLIAHLQDKFPDYLTVSPPIGDLQAFYKVWHCHCVIIYLRQRKSKTTLNLPCTEILNLTNWAGEVVCWFKAHTALPEDLRSVPSTTAGGSEF